MVVNYEVEMIDYIKRRKLKNKINYYCNNINFYLLLLGSLLKYYFNSFGTANCL